jgi:hypothetical protein
MKGGVSGGSAPVVRNDDGVIVDIYRHRTSQNTGRETMARV